jgi:hypothetical protein
LYIIDVFLDAQINNCLDSRDDISIRKIFGCNLAHFFNKTLKILEAILIIFKFIHNSNDSSLKSIVAFSIWNRYYFSSTDFSVWFSNLTIGRDERLWYFGDYFFLSGLHMWVGTSLNSMADMVLINFLEVYGYRFLLEWLLSGVSCSFWISVWGLIRWEILDWLRVILISFSVLLVSINPSLLMGDVLYFSVFSFSYYSLWMEN